MKMLRYAVLALALAAAPLAGCASLTGVAPSQAASTVSLRADQGLTLAALAYSAWTVTLTASRSSLTDEQWHRWQAKDRELYAMLTRAQQGVESAQAILDALATATTNLSARRAP